MKHTRNKLRPLAALVLALMLAMLPSTPSGASESQAAEAETEFIEWYNADPANQAYYEWLVFMQDPANADWFEWKTTAPSVEQIIAEVFGSSYATALRVASCESGLDPNAVSPTNDHGVFQINETTWNKPWHSDPVAQYIGSNWGRVYDPYTNTLMAKKLIDHYGWDHWACY